MRTNLNKIPIALLFHFVKRRITYFQCTIGLICFISAQTISYSQCTAPITATDPTVTAASCPSSGQIIVNSSAESESSAVYQITAGPSSGGYQTTSQSSSTFNGLPAGAYTIRITCGTYTKDVTAMVDDDYTPLGLTAVVTGVCSPAGGSGGNNRVAATLSAGTITANATGGKGPLMYAFLLSNNAAEPDQNFTYNSPNDFTALSFGTYQVRVKDACNNFVTKSVDVKPTSPKADITFASRSYSCSEILMNGSILKTASGTISPVNSGYILELYYLNDADPCTQPASPASGTTGVTIPINSVADLNLHVPGTTEKLFYRVISPCGEVTTGCQDLVPLIFSATAKVHVGCPDGDAVSLAIRPNGSAPYSAVVQGFDAGNNPVAPNAVTYNFTANSAITGVPYADHYTYTVTDACGRSFSGTAKTPVSGDGTTVNSLTASLTCTNVVGTSQISVNISGYIPDQDAAGITLLDAANTVVATAAFYNSQTGTIVFNNVPSGSYFIRFAPTDAACASVTKVPITIPPYSKPLAFSLDGTSSQLCGGTGTISSNLTYNASAASSTVSYELLTGTTVLATNASGTFANLAAGTYTLKATATAGCGLSSLTATKQLTIQPGDSNPVVVKKLGINCSNDPATGIAVFEFSGFGPFLLEMKKTTETNFTIIGTAVPNNYTATGLSADTDYDVRITDQCGKTSVTQVSIKPLVAVYVTNTAQPCLDQPYTLSAEDIVNAEYSWTFNDGPVMSTAKDIIFGSYLQANDGKYVCTITLGDCITKVLTVNLNSINCSQPLAKSGLGDYVWFDQNADGIQDTSEGGASGITVTLYAQDGITTIATTTTDAAGQYSFPNLTEGSYVVGFSNLPVGYLFSASTGALNDPTNSDANISSGKTPVIVLAANEFNLNIDAGIYNKLPVTLISFTAKMVEGHAVLNWSTSWETNSDHFEIEHSLNGKSWQKIGNVLASGESNSVKTYQFTHTNKLSGMNYYRLRMVDLDLTYSYSRIQQVNMSNANENAVMFPNPVSEKLFLNPDLIQNVREIVITDINGRVVFTSHNIPTDGINVKKLSPGIHLVRIKQKTGGELNHPILILR